MDNYNNKHKGISELPESLAKLVMKRPAASLQLLAMVASIADGLRVASAR